MFYNVKENIFLKINMNVYCYTFINQATETRYQKKQ